MFNEYIGALMLIFFAEFGDKTQILAMMFSTKYPVKKVLLGIFLGSFLNHGIAILIGNLLGNVLNPNLLQMVAGIAFIGFAFWTLLGKDEEEESIEKVATKGAVFTVASAFFIGELGDKTQLTAITLSVDSAFPFIVLLGTVSGMLVTSSIGIFVGSKVGDKIPELAIKLISGTVFMVFGVQKLISATPEQFINGYTLALFITAIIFGLIIVIKDLVKGIKSGELTPYRRAAKNLYDYTHRNLQYVESVCRTVNHCGTCKGEACGVGLIRHILTDINRKELDNHQEKIKRISSEKDKFSRSKLIHMLQMNVSFLINYKYKDRQYEEVDNIRKVIEILLFDEWLDFEDKNKYINELKLKDLNIGESVEKTMSAK